MLKGLSRRITLYSINKPREVRFGGYTENGIQISGIMFDVNYKELKLATESLGKLSESEGVEIG